ncbi:MAG: endonuclease/exonuclease/phosphatase family protein [Acetobacteraceae bacterium]|nr:endonuclease/exonuclease/phosphatase family protein [Acetobacteraceae bacterium]
MTLRRALSLALVTVWVLFAIGVALSWNLAGSHLPHLPGGAALAMGILAVILGSLTGAALWLGSGLALLLLPLLASAGPDPRPEPGCRITAMTFNAKLLRSGRRDAVAELLGAHPADIILLQETGDRAELARLLLEQPGLRGWHVATPPDLLLMAVSRFPLAPGLRHGGILETSVRVEGQRLRLFTAIGPKPTAPGQAATFARQLRDLVAGSPDGALVGLDLNAGPASASARLLRTVLRDAAMDTGLGAAFGFTFPTPARRLGTLGPWARIDQLLVTPGLRPDGWSVLAAHAESTHFPLFGQFVLAGAGTPGEACRAG